MKGGDPLTPDERQATTELAGLILFCAAGLFLLNLAGFRFAVSAGAG